MTNPRLPFLAGGIAVLALAFTQALGWSILGGFLFGWSLLALTLVAQRAFGAIVRNRRSLARWLTQAASRLMVVAHMRRAFTRDDTHAPFPGGV